MTIEVYQKALEYAKRGVRCVPCGPDKRAIKADWRNCTTTDPEQVREYFEHTDYQLAIVPADVGRVVILPKQPQLNLPVIKNLPETYTVTPPSGDGEHRWFRTDEVFGRAFLRGARVVSDQGYVIVPPSPGYEENDVEPAPLPAGVASMIRLGNIPARGLEDFLAHTFITATPLLGHWLPQGGSCLLSAYTGTGKTMMALGISAALATGTEFLGWHPDRPRRVLYVDGEMSGEHMQDRLRSIAGHFSPRERRLLAENFRIISHEDAGPEGIPNLSDPFSGGRELIEGHAEDHEADLIVLDNLSVLGTVLGKSDNDDTSWHEMGLWIGKLRRRGHAVLILHHTGKPDKETGETRQRGTSKREDTLDSSIVVTRIGEKLTWRFTKYRGCQEPAEREPFEFSISVDCWCERTDASETNRELRSRILALHAENPRLGQRKIAELCGTSKTRVQRVLGEGEAQNDAAAWGERLRAAAATVRETPADHP